MQRRDFLGVLGGAAAAWPLAARAQQPNRKPRIAVLLSGNTQQNRGNVARFTKAMQRLGWTDGENIQIEYR